MIIDESLFGHVCNPACTDWSTVRQALNGTRAASKQNQYLHVGGTYWKQKLRLATTFQVFVLTLGRGGRVKQVADNLVDQLEVKWQNTPGLTCDTDHWALALAEAAKTKLLASDDKPLTSDFKTHLAGVVISSLTATNDKAIQGLLALNV